MGVSFFVLASICRVPIQRWLFVAISIRLKKLAASPSKIIAGTAVDSASLGLERIGASPLLRRNQS
jgi:hypothetical protein